MFSQFFTYMTHLDLFSGIGGFALAARWIGIETKAFCEIEPYARRVLNKNFPNVPIHEDIRKLDGTQYNGIGIITGGYPCQPFSTAGKKLGADDPRHLWPEMRRIINEAKPSWVLCENVEGHVRNGLDEVCGEMEEDGYEVQPMLVPASGVGARQRRKRVWILAHRKSDGRRQGDQNQGRGLARTSERQEQGSRDAFDSVWRESLKSLFRGETHGVSHRVDRLRGLGNAIVPQVAYEIMRAITLS